MGSAVTMILAFFLVIVLMGTIYIMFRRNIVDSEIKEKKISKFKESIQENYEATKDAGGLCTRCTHHGRTANLNVYKSKKVNTLLVVHCPTCGSLFQLNLNQKKFPLVSSVGTKEQKGQKINPIIKPVGPSGSVF